MMYHGSVSQETKGNLVITTERNSAPGHQQP